jgi:hypothetical protein
VVVAAACESSKAPPPVVKKDAAVARDAAIAIDAVEKKTFVTSADRCGECHGKMYDEWSTSEHAQAATSKLYVATREASCDRCHVPLAQIHSEGVTCDVCHTLRDPKPSDAGASFRLAIDDMVKYGPRCDLKDHYFHRMGCSPEHRAAEMCGTCHLWKPNGLPVFTEYEDWKAGPAAARGEVCQDCHMPKEKAAIATGSPVRTGVPHHGLLGLARDLRGRALGLVVAVRDDAGKLAVDITVKNLNAGHTVPSGLPEHRLLVHVRAGDATETRVLGRVLVDAAGAEVPFWKATKVGSDTRIAPGGEWKDTVSLAKGSTVEVDVVYRGLSDAVAKELGVADIEEHVMVSAKVAPGKTVTVMPPPPGKRPAKGATP